MFAKHRMFRNLKLASKSATKITLIMIKLAKYAIEMAFYAKIWTF